LTLIAHFTNQTCQYNAENKHSETITHRNQADPHINKNGGKNLESLKNYPPPNQSRSQRKANDKKPRISNCTLPQSNTPCNAEERFVKIGTHYQS